MFFEKVFVTRPWKALFVTTDDDIREWWSRWRVDRYSVAWGLTFGAGLVALQRLDHIPGTAFSSVLALISLIAYTTFTILCHSVSECEEIHSYVAFIPVNHPDLSLSLHFASQSLLLVLSNCHSIVDPRLYRPSKRIAGPTRQTFCTSGWTG